MENSLSPLNPTEDGTTHINVYSKGKTQLGRLLSNFTRSQLVLGTEGTFASVEGYWYWLLAKDVPTAQRDELRHKAGWDAKRLGRELLQLQEEQGDYRDNPEFRKKVYGALDYKLRYFRWSGRDLKDLLKESTLPLVHYYVYGDKVHTPKEGQWVQEHLVLRRKQLQEGSFT